jgi:hypothetical protein
MVCTILRERRLYAGGWRSRVLGWLIPNRGKLDRTCACIGGGGLGAISSLGICSTILCGGGGGDGSLSLPLFVCLALRILLLFACLPLFSDFLELYAQSKVS